MINNTHIIHNKTRIYYHNNNSSRNNNYNNLFKSDVINSNVPINLAIFARFAKMLIANIIKIIIIFVSKKNQYIKYLPINNNNKYNNNNYNRKV